MLKITIYNPDLGKSLIYQNMMQLKRKYKFVQQNFPDMFKSKIVNHRFLKVKLNQQTNVKAFLLKERSKTKQNLNFSPWTIRYLVKQHKWKYKKRRKNLHYIIRQARHRNRFTQICSFRSSFFWRYPHAKMRRLTRYSNLMCLQRIKQQYNNFYQRSYRNWVQNLSKLIPSYSILSISPKKTNVFVTITNIHGETQGFVTAKTLNYFHRDKRPFFVLKEVLYEAVQRYAHILLETPLIVTFSRTSNLAKASALIRPLFRLFRRLNVIKIIPWSVVMHGGTRLTTKRRRKNKWKNKFVKLGSDFKSPVWERACLWFKKTKPLYSPLRGGLLNLTKIQQSTPYNQSVRTFCHSSSQWQLAASSLPKLDVVTVQKALVPTTSPINDPPGDVRWWDSGFRIDSKTLTVYKKPPTLGFQLKKKYWMFKDKFLCFVVILRNALLKKFRSFYIKSCEKSELNKDEFITLQYLYLIMIVLFLIFLFVFFHIMN